MSWRTAIVAAGLSALTTFAQTLPRLIVKPGAPIDYTETGRKLLELVKNYRPDQSSVCSIPLTEVPVARSSKPMPILRPRQPVEPMPLVPLPAPPCKEEKR